MEHCGWGGGSGSNGGGGGGSGSNGGGGSGSADGVVVGVVCKGEERKMSLATKTLYHMGEGDRRTDRQEGQHALGKREEEGKVKEGKVFARVRRETKTLEVFLSSMQLSGSVESNDGGGCVSRGCCASFQMTL